MVFSIYAALAIYVFEHEILQINMKKNYHKRLERNNIRFLVFLEHGNTVSLQPYNFFFFPACHSNHVAMFDYYPYFSTRNIFYPHLKPLFARVSFTWHNLNSSCPQGYHS